MDEWYFKWQKGFIKWRLFKCAIIFLFIGLFIGVGLGMAWRITQVEPEHQATVRALKEKITYYKSNWTPIKEKEVKFKRGAGNKKGK